MTGQHSTKSRLRWKDFPLDGADTLSLTAMALALVAVGSVLGWLIVGPLDSSVGAIDRSVSNWFASIRTPTWNTISDVVGSTADVIVKIPVAVVATIAFLWKWKRWIEAVILDLALIFESTVFVAIAFIVDRSRPAIEQLDSIPPTGSFPSGHSAAAVAFYGAIAIIVWLNTSNRLARWVAGLAAVLMPIGVALSRLYRGMHFLTDVIFGLLLGVVSLWWVWRTLRPHVLEAEPQTKPSAAGEILT